MCLGHVMGAEQADEVLLEEHSSSDVGELVFYRIRQELRKVSGEMYIAVVTFWGDKHSQTVTFQRFILQINNS